MLDAHQLNVFLTAARTLNFTAAAKQLHMTQPSVSQHIQALEQHFGTSLFVRAGRQLRLTDAGKELMTMAHDMVAMSLHIDEKMESLKGEVHGHLMVGCSTTIGKYVLPFLLAAFMRQNPRVSASCLVTPRRVAMQNLCDGEVHLALASSHEFCGGVEFHKFIQDPIVLIVPVDHPWAAAGAIEIDDLMTENFIVREEGSGTRTVAASALADAGVSFNQLNSVLTLGNSEAIALAVQEGIGVGFISQMVTANLVRDTVAVVQVNGLSMHQDIYLGQSETRAATTAQKAFWEFATDRNNPVVRQLAVMSKQDGRLPQIDFAEELAEALAV